MSTASGSRAEDATAEYLSRAGYKIMFRNWRTKWCELDIVATRTIWRRFRRVKTLYVIEVKYRSQLDQGSGLQYVDRRKQQRLKRGSESLVQKLNWSHQVIILAIEVLGQNMEVSEPIMISYDD